MAKGKSKVKVIDEGRLSVHTGTLVGSLLSKDKNIKVLPVKILKHEERELRNQTVPMV